MDDSRQSRDSGFSLVELVIALTVLAVTMGSLTYALSSSMRVVSWSEQRQTAAGLANEVLEQVRALAFSAVAGGMSAVDIAAVQAGSSPDPHIVGSAAPYTFAPNSEQIVAGKTTANPPAPLYPYRTGPQLVNGTGYTTATYVTQPSASLCTGCYRVTVIVSWTATQVPTSNENQVSVDTLLATPDTGCISSATHPFTAPCQPFFYGQASSGVASISITPATAGQAGISDLLGNTLNLSQAQLNLFEDDSTLQNEQVSQVSGDVQTDGMSLQLLGANALTGGGVEASGQADNDPTIGTNMPQPASVYQGGLTSLSQGTPGGNLLTLTTSNNDSGTVVSTTAAGSGSGCNDLSSPAVAQSTGQPCGSASVTQDGTGSGSGRASNATMTAGLSLGSPGIGSLTLASVAPATTYSPTKTFVAYYPAHDGTAADCANSSGDGCIHAGGSETIGTVAVGGLPSLLTPLAGWGGYLVKLTNYTAAVATESGGGAASPSASCSYTISYWTGAGYSTTTCGSGTTITTSYTQSTLLLGSLVAVNMSGSFQTGAASVSTGPGTESAQVTPPLSGSVVLTITVGGIQVVNLDVSVSLGTLLAQTDYQAAPSAS